MNKDFKIEIIDNVIQTDSDIDDIAKEGVFFWDFDCAGDEVLVESSPPASPADMAARLAAPAQGGGGGGGGAGAGGPAEGASPGAVRELIVIPEIPNSIHLHHAMHQVSNTVVEVNSVEVNGDSSGHSSPTADGQHTYITVAVEGPWKGNTASSLKPEVKYEMESSDQESEGGAGVNYHVQYVEPQEIYTQPHAAHMETLRTYPVYSVATVGGGAEGAGGGAAGAGGGADADGGWGVGGGVFAAYDVLVAADEAETPASPATPAAAPAAPHQPPRMPPATVQWLLDNYETAEGVSLPRSTLYAHYLRHCAAHRLEPVNAASFGKLIRSVFVGLRTRRLGTRGNSKYHYYGIRAKASAPDSPPDDDDKTDLGEGREREGSVGPGVGGGAGGAGAGSAHRQYLGSVNAPEPPELVVEDLPEDVPRTALDALREHHRVHGVEFLEAVASLDTVSVERARRAFWRRPAAGLCRRVLLRLAARRDVAAWLRRAELGLHQRAVELLLPDVLRPIPPHLTQAIRNFAKTLEAALSAGSSGAPAAAARAQAFAAAALAAALRRYTSLNHLAQAARAVLHNQHQIQQMLADLNRVDFRVVREQAAWACSCPSAATATRLEADFKATLGRGASLEQWAAWLESCVRTALAPHERRPDYSARARRFLLDWSFYSSLVIRELTLRSAASFGSFHLIRLLYDEYVAYLIERRVAAHEKAPPIAVMHRVQESEEETESNEGGGDIPPEGDVDDQDPDEDDPDWEWEDEDDDTSCKKPKIE